MGCRESWADQRAGIWALSQLRLLTPSPPPSQCLWIFISNLCSPRSAAFPEEKPCRGSCLVCTRSENAVGGAGMQRLYFGKLKALWGKKLKLIHREVLNSRWAGLSLCPFTTRRLSISPVPPEATGKPLAWLTCAAIWLAGKGATQVKV